MKRLNYFLSSSYGKKITKLSPIILLYIIIIGPAATIVATNASNTYLAALILMVFTFISLGFIVYTIKQYMAYIKTKQ